MKKAELELGKPFFTTYHFQGLSGAVSPHTSSVKNWYINHSVHLNCNKAFLYGFSSPHLNILKSSWTEYPYFDKYIYPMRFLNNDVHHLICELIDNGYYVNFDGVDDYYLEGKTWYKVRHFCHDGLIFGYDKADKTYNVFAYNSNFQYSNFRIKQASFNRGKKQMMSVGVYGNLAGVKPSDKAVEIEPEIICGNLKEYLDSTFDKYPVSADNEVNGIIVHKYLEMYLDRLYEGIIEYDKMDWRIFRVLCDHKNFMHERIKGVEQKLKFDTSLSEEYKKAVDNCNTMHVLYSSHHKKRRDSVLPIVKKLLSETDDTEHKVLTKLIKRMEAAM